MEALYLIRKTRQYLDYLEEHILNVEKAWKELRTACGDMDIIRKHFHELDRKIKNHDISKLYVEEFVQYRKNFYRADSEGFNKEEIDKAFQHHYDHNDHHWQNWKNNLDTLQWQICCVHMIVDWMAMGYKFKDNAQTYYEKYKDDIRFPKFVEDFMYEIFDRLYSPVSKEFLETQKLIFPREESI